jgi:Mg/Co/Ni transporter MgtE
VYDYAGGKADWLAYGLPTEGNDASTPRAGDVVKREVPTCHLDDDLKTALERARAAGWDSCVVVNATGVVLGRVRAEALDRAPDQSIDAVLEAGPATVRPSEELEGLVQRMQNRQVNQILVTTSDGRLAGILRRDDAERLLQQHEHDRDNAAG